MDDDRAAPAPPTSHAAPMDNSGDALAASSTEQAGNADVDNGGGEKPVTAPTLPPLRFAVLAVGVSLGLFLSMLDASIVATSLFAIAVEFRDVDRVNWVALAYTLTYLGCAVLFARVSDVVGRRAAFVAAYVVFVVFSIACGFGQTMQQLVAFRALQGLGGSGLYSVCMIILPELTPDRMQKYIAMVIGVVIASSGVLGPVLGGILTQYTSWRWVFWINGPIGGFSLLVFLLAWPDKKYLPSLERRALREVDFVGAFLLIAAAVLIVFPFQNSSSSRRPTWSDATFLAPLLAGLLSLAGLFAWQLFAGRHLGGGVASAAALPPVLLRNRAYAAAALHTMLVGFPFLLCVYAFPLRFQVVYGKSALQAGLMLLPMLAASAAGTAAAGALNGRANRLFETLMVAGAVMLLGCGLEMTAGDGADGLAPGELGFLVFVGLGFGMSAAGATMIAVTEAPMWEHASAQGIIAQLRVFGGSLGIAASSAILGTKVRSGSAGGSVSPEVLAQLASDPTSFSPAQWAVVRRVYTDALREDMVVCCAVLAAVLLCTLGVYRRGRLSMQEMNERRRRQEAERRRAMLASQGGTGPAGV